MPETIVTVATAIGADATAAAAAIDGALGVAAGTTATVAEAVGAGAGIGGAVGGITGGEKGLVKGLEGGALTGLGGGIGGAAGGILGAGLGGAAGGAAGGAVTGGNIGTSALEGGLGAALSAGVAGDSLTGGMFGGSSPSLDQTASNIGNMINDPALTPAGTTGAPSTTPSAGAVTSGAGASSAGTAAPAGSETNPFTSGISGDASNQFSFANTPTSGTPTGTTQSSSIQEQTGAPDTGGGSPSIGGSAPSGNALTFNSSAFGNQGTSLTNALNTAGNLTPDQLAQNDASYSKLQPYPGQDTSTGNTGGGSTGGGGGGSNSNVTGNNSLVKGGLSGAISNFEAGNYGTALGDIAPAALAGGGLALDAIRGNSAVKGENQLKGIANQEAAQGGQLESYLTSGTLPPALQAAVDQATASATASVKSRYAAMGQSGSSAEQEDLANIQQNAQASSAQAMLSLLNQGISETGAAANLFSNIMQTSLANDQQLSASLSSFVTALAGGAPTGGIRIVQGG